MNFWLYWFMFSVCFFCAFVFIEIVLAIQPISGTSALGLVIAAVITGLLVTMMFRASEVR